MRRVAEFFLVLVGSLGFCFVVLHYSFQLLAYFYLTDVALTQELSDLIPVRRLMLNLVFIHIAIYTMAYGIAKYLYWESGVVMFLSALLATTINFGDIYFQFNNYPNGAPCLVGQASTRDVDAFYFSVVTFTTLGYGDIRPFNVCRAYAMSEAIVGLIFFPYFLAFLVTHEGRRRRATAR